MTPWIEKLFSLPRTILSLLTIFLLGGVLSYVNVPKEASPNIDIPILYVSATEKGIAPEDAKRLLASPLEKALQNLDSLKDITSTSSEGHAGILLEFDINFDKDTALNDAQTEIDSIKATLPKDTKIKITEVNLAQKPTITVMLSGEVPFRILREKAEKLSEDIEAIPTVLETTVIGVTDEVVEIIIDRMKMNSYQLTFRQLFDAISLNHTHIPAGSIKNDYGSFKLKIPGIISKHNELEDIVVKSDGNSLVKLSDVAKIYRTYKTEKNRFRFNGKKAISIEVTKRIGENLIETNKKIREIVEKANASEEQIDIEYTLDESKNIFNILNSLNLSIMTAIILVMTVILFTLGTVSAFLVGFSILSSFMIGFLIIDMLGMSVNMMVTFGLVLTVGILVDGAIVITEYADRKMEEGVSRTQAYKLSVHRMFLPTLSSIATTLAAFLPMLLWPGVPGKFMSYLPIVVIIVLLSSLVTAVVFLPVIGSVLNTRKIMALLGALWLSIGIYFLQSGNFILFLLFSLVVVTSLTFLNKRKSTIDSEILNIHDKKIKNTDLTKIENKSTKNSIFTERYLSILSYLIKKPIITTIGVFSLVGLIIFTATVIRPPGVQFFIAEEPSYAFLIVSSRGNFSMKQIQETTLKIERELLQVKGIENLTAKFGEKVSSKSSNLQQDTIAIFTLELQDYCCRRKAEKIFSEIQKRVSKFPGILLELRKLKNGPVSLKAINLEILGEKYEDVFEATQKVRQYFNQLSGLRDILDTSAPGTLEWVTEVDREKAGKFGTNIASIGTLVQLITQGSVVGRYRPNDSSEEIDLRIRLPEGQRSLKQLDTLHLMTASGPIPVSHFVTFNLQQAISSIESRGNNILMLVSADVQKGVFAQDKIEEIRNWIDTQIWKDSIKFEFTGSEKEQKESEEFLVKAMFIALFLIGIILITQFNSFYQTFLTLSTILLSSAGVFLGILVTGQSFSIIMTGTGIIALVGIIVNHSIILTDTYNHMRNTYGLSPIEATLSAASQRLRPILITTLTTILGLIPMALQLNFDFFQHQITVGSIQSSWWVQFSTTIIFGLGFATLLTLVLTPVLLSAPSVLKERWKL